MPLLTAADGLMAFIVLVRLGTLTGRRWLLGSENMRLISFTHAYALFLHEGYHIAVV
jgi:hypothetical protein